MSNADLAYRQIRLAHRLGREGMTEAAATALALAVAYTARASAR